MTPTVGVCGFGRCGSTMLMCMLDAGGLPPVAGSDPTSYELPALDALPAVEGLAGRSVKLLDAVLHAPLPAASWRFVWVDRDGYQQAKSYAKFVAALLGMRLSVRDRRELAASYDRDRPRALVELSALGPVRVVTFETALRHPSVVAGDLGDWLADVVDLDSAAMAGAVHRRSPKCLDGLDFETSATGGGAA